MGVSVSVNEIKMENIKKNNIIFVLGWLLFIVGILISDKSNIGIFIGITGGVIMGNSLSVNKPKTKEINKKIILLNLVWVLFFGASAILLIKLFG